jgi:hypothetical protein
VNAELFLLAFAAALKPKLLALDLLLIENRRPRAMFGCILASGLGVAIAIGLVNVLLSFMLMPSRARAGPARALTSRPPWFCSLSADRW